MVVVIIYEKERSNTGRTDVVVIRKIVVVGSVGAVVLDLVITKLLNSTSGTRFIHWNK
jgi:hypothetical protein